LYILAGVNGAGKSSVVGAVIQQHGASFFNPDEAARRIQSANPGVRLEEVNSRAWQEGVRLLTRAVAERLTFALETTLGGSTISELLASAAASGMEVRMWYVGLDSPERHMARVRSRVEKGGHDVPEDRIRARYDSSRLNLIRLLPDLTELRVYDNSKEADPDAGATPELKLLLHWARDRVVSHCPLPQCPEWAKPILMAAVKLRSSA
jgi:predicted ABC-type ATPase